MPVCRVVSPSLKREPDVVARTSDADGRVSAASVIAPLNHWGVCMGGPLWPPLDDVPRIGVHDRGAATEGSPYMPLKDA
jgi:hypothetical protein